MDTFRGSAYALRDLHQPLHEADSISFMCSRHDLIVPRHRVPQTLSYNHNSYHTTVFLNGKDDVCLALALSSAPDTMSRPQYRVC